MKIIFYIIGVVVSLLTLSQESFARLTGNKEIELRSAENRDPSSSSSGGALGGTKETTVSNNSS